MCFPVVLLFLGWSLRTIDTLTARTTLRLWHTLYMERKRAHDFEHVFAPNKHLYLSAVSDGEIHAIACCKHGFNVTLIAESPDRDDAAVALLRLLRENNVTMDLTELKRQPRWFLEDMFLETDL